MVLGRRKLPGWWDVCWAGLKERGGAVWMFPEPCSLLGAALCQAGLVTAVIITL